MAQSNQKQKSPTSDNSAFGRGIATVASSAERVGSTKGKGRLDRLPVRPALWKSTMCQISRRFRGRRRWWIRRSRYHGYQHPNSLAACLGNPAPRLWCDARRCHRVNRSDSDRMRAVSLLV